MIWAGPRPAVAAGGHDDAAEELWTSIDAADLEARKAGDVKPWVRPRKFSAFELDPTALDALLTAVPEELGLAAKVLPPTVVTVPMPDGRLERFSVVASPVAQPELEAWLADQGWPMRTYRGTSLDRPGASVRFDWGGPAGFHAMVLTPEGSIFVDPYWQGDVRHYVSYHKRDYQADGKDFRCEVTDHQPAPNHAREGTKNTSGRLRTYRLATAATAEYTVFHGGTRARGQAAIVTSINRVNMIYERDLSVRMVLVGNNMNVVYTNAATDPYNNNSCGAMLPQNQTNLDAVIGTANYDIGHVFSTGGGGVATLRSPCDAARKARGCTGTSSPTGDPFDVDFVAHEIGHQWGANHTWNGTRGSCMTSQWQSTAAYEPGSGTTIMGYAGICAADNIKNRSDDYFHRRSIDEMMSFISFPGNCSVNVSGVNPSEPFVDAGPSFTIPHRTPFELTARDGRDNDGDALTYTWEEFDLGTQASLTTGDDGTQPIFRSWPPGSSPTRTFPRLRHLLAGTVPRGETLPTTDRTMRFEVTVRDNRSGGGREDDDGTTVRVTTRSGPFVVRSPNGGETWSGSRTVTWNVANTTAFPVGAANVDVLLSVDGGNTFPFALATATPNDGSERIGLPDFASTTARVKVRGTGNIFFDISNADFTLSSRVTSAPAMLILLDRTGSMRSFRSGTGNTRCEDALELAKQDVRNFMKQNPTGFVEVWTFTNSSPTNLTGGLVGEAAALAALGTLSPTGCSGSTPLAEAMCSASDALDAVNLGGGQKVLAVSSDGGENNSSGECAGFNSSSDTPPYDPGSWQNKVYLKLRNRGVVLARFWGSVARPALDEETGERLSPDKFVLDSRFFEQLATDTGGDFLGVEDTDPGIPQTFFRGIFTDGFESGDLSSWSSLAGASP